MKATTLTIALTLLSTVAWAGPPNPQQTVVDQIDKMTVCGHERHVAEAAVNDRKAGTLETSALAVAMDAKATSTDIAIVRAAYALPQYQLADPDAARNFAISVLYACHKENK